MSRKILNDHRWNADEIQYFMDRGRLNEIAINQEQFPPGSEPDVGEDDSVVLELSQKVYEYVSSRTVSQLQSELKNAGLSIKGDETSLRVALAQHLQEKEDAAADA